jgi:hypothetical protein
MDKPRPISPTDLYLELGTAGAPALIDVQTGPTFDADPRIPSWKGLGADSEEKHEPVSDIDTAVVDSLTCLTPDGRLEKRTSEFPFRVMIGAVAANRKPRTPQGEASYSAGGSVGLRKRE